MTETEFPLWVRKEAAKRANAELRRSRRMITSATGEYNEKSVVNFATGKALCRLILETMQEPVDPLVEAFNRLPPEWNAEIFVKSIRATLDSLGFKIVEASQ